MGLSYPLQVVAQLLILHSIEGIWNAVHSLIPTLVCALFKVSVLDLQSLCLISELCGWLSSSMLGQIDLKALWLTSSL